MNIDLYYLTHDALAMANVILLGAALIAILRVHRLLGATAIHSKLAAGAAIEAEIAALSETGRLVCSQLAQIQERIESLGVIERLLEEPASRGLPMDRATTLARSGATVDELTRSCGLNVGEARLMRRLHSGDAVAQPNIRS